MPDTGNKLPAIAGVALGLAIAVGGGVATSGRFLLADHTGAGTTGTPSLSTAPMPEYCYYKTSAGTIKCYQRDPWSCTYPNGEVCTTKTATTYGGMKCYNAQGAEVPESEKWDTKQTGLQWGCYNADGSDYKWPPYDPANPTAGSASSCPYSLKQNGQVVTGYSCDQYGCQYPDGSRCDYADYESCILNGAEVPKRQRWKDLNKNISWGSCLDEQGRDPYGGTTGTTGGTGYGGAAGGATGGTTGGGTTGGGGTSGGGQGCKVTKFEIYSPSAGKVVGYTKCTSDGPCVKYDLAGNRIPTCDGGTSGGGWGGSGGMGGTTTGGGWGGATSGTTGGTSGGGTTMRNCKYLSAEFISGNSLGKPAGKINDTVFCESDYVNCKLVSTGEALRGSDLMLGPANTCESWGTSGAASPAPSPAPVTTYTTVRKCTYPNAEFISGNSLGKPAGKVGESVICEEDYYTCRLPSTGEMTSPRDFALGAPSSCENSATGGGAGGTSGGTTTGGGWGGATSGTTGGTAGTPPCYSGSGIPEYPDAYTQGAGVCADGEPDKKDPTEEMRCYENPETGEAWYGYKETGGIVQAKSYCYDLGLKPGQRMKRGLGCYRIHDYTSDTWRLMYIVTSPPEFKSSVEKISSEECTKRGMTKDSSIDITKEMRGKKPAPGPECGNAICEEGEGGGSCPPCYPGAPMYPECMAMDCAPGTCPADCEGPGPGPECGNGICEEGEDMNCPTCPSGRMCPMVMCSPLPWYCPADCVGGPVSPPPPGDQRNLEQRRKDETRMMRDRERQGKDMRRQAKQNGIADEAFLELIKKYEVAATAAIDCIEGARSTRDIDLCTEGAWRTLGDLEQKIWPRLQAGNTQSEVKRFRTQELKNMEREVKRLEREDLETSELNQILEEIEGILSQAEKVVKNDPEEAQLLLQDIWQLQADFWDTMRTLEQELHAKELKERLAHECDEFERQASRERTSALTADLQEITDACVRAVEDATAALEDGEEPWRVEEDFRWAMEDLWGEFHALMEGEWAQEACTDAEQGLADAKRGLREELPTMMAETRKEDPALATIMEDALAQATEATSEIEDLLEQGECREAITELDQLRFEISRAFGLVIIDYDREYEELVEDLEGDEGRHIIRGLRQNDYGMREIQLLKRIAREVLDEYFAREQDTEGPDIIKHAAELQLSEAKLQELLQVRSDLLKEIAALKEDVKALRDELGSIVAEIQSITFGPKTAEKVEVFIERELPTLSPEEAEERLEELKEEGNTELYTEGIIPFVDTPLAADVWYTTYAAKAKDYGLIQGTDQSDGTKLEPARETNIAEAITMVARSLPDGIDEEAEPQSALGQSLPGWAEPAAGTLEKAGIDLDAIFADAKPSDACERGEVAQLIAQAHDLEVMSTSGGPSFTDIATAPRPERDAIMAVSAAGIMLGDAAPHGGAETTFRYADPLNRAELATVLTRVVENLSEGAIPYLHETP